MEDAKVIFNLGRFKVMMNNTGKKVRNIMFTWQLPRKRIQVFFLLKMNKMFGNTQLCATNPTLNLHLHYQWISTLTPTNWGGFKMERLLKC